MRYLLKYAGIFTVVLCLSFTGFLKAYLKREEIRRLKRMRGSLCRAGDMLTLSNTDRRTIINECFGNSLKEGGTGKANEVMNSFLEGFGSGDISLELKRIERAKVEITELIAKGETEYAGLSKIWKTAGVCAGLAAGLMLG